MATQSAISFRTLTIGGNDTAMLKLSTGTANPGELIIKNKGTLEQNSSLVLYFSTVTIESGGKLTHTANAASKQYHLNLDVAGDFTLQSGATIIVDSLGYAGGGNRTSGYGPGAGKSFDNTNGSGAGHGGVGGYNDGNFISGGLTYDSFMFPNDLGGGGHDERGGRDSNSRLGGGIYDSVTQPIDMGSGGDGGGLLIATVGGRLTVDGTISANGGDGINNGGGADLLKSRQWRGNKCV